MDNLKEKLINKYLSHFAESKKLGKSIDNYTELDLNCHKKKSIYKNGNHDSLYSRFGNNKIQEQINIDQLKHIKPIK